MRTGLTLMIYKPDKRKPGMFSFKEPLHKNVWLCIAIGFLTTSVILFLIGRFSPFEWSQNSEEGPSSEFSMSNSLWSTLGALMQQGSDISPRFFSENLITKYIELHIEWTDYSCFMLFLNRCFFLTMKIRIDAGLSLGGARRVHGGSSRSFWWRPTPPTWRRSSQWKAWISK